MKTLKDPTMVIDLYYCGTLERPQKIKEILKNGFSEDGKFSQQTLLVFVMAVKHGLHIGIMTLKASVLALSGCHTFGFR